MASSRGLLLLGLATLGLFLVLALIDIQLVAEGGPGIVPFELAFTTAEARATLADWGSSGRDLARLSLWIDFGFLLAYGAFFALAAFALCEALGIERFSFVGTLPPVAAAADALENVALLLTLGQGGSQPWPLMAGVFASIKFFLLTPAVLFVVTALFLRLRGPSSRS